MAPSWSSSHPVNRLSDACWMLACVACRGCAHSCHDDDDPGLPLPEEELRVA